MGAGRWGVVKINTAPRVKFKALFLIWSENWLQQCSSETSFHRRSVLSIQIYVPTKNKKSRQENSISMVAHTARRLQEELRWGWVGDEDTRQTRLTDTRQTRMTIVK